jgi:hypothetical protein
MNIQTLMPKGLCQLMYHIFVTFYSFILKAGKGLKEKRSVPLNNQL